MFSKPSDKRPPLLSLIAGISLIALSTRFTEQNSGWPLLLAGTGLCALFIAVYLLILYATGGGDLKVGSRGQNRQNRGRREQRESKGDNQP